MLCAAGREADKYIQASIVLCQPRKKNSVDTIEKHKQGAQAGLSAAFAKKLHNMINYARARVCKSTHVITKQRRESA